MEIRQNGICIWLWDVENVRNKLIRVETGWSTFEERARNKTDGGIDVRELFEENLMSEIGRTLGEHLWLRHDANEDGGRDAGTYVLSLG